MKKQTQQTDDEKQYNLPITIVLENLTNERIKNVKVFNCDYKNQSDIQYSANMVEYDMVLRHLAVEKEAEKHIIYMRIESEQVKREITVQQFPVRVDYSVTALDGKLFSRPFIFEILPEQSIKYVSETEAYIRWNNQMQLQISHITAKNKLYLRLYPDKSFHQEITSADRVVTLNKVDQKS